MRTRHSKIAETHAKTFEWIFDPASSSGDFTTTKFKEWLEYGEGIFWISGKAGSGKSTLMKFITGDERTYHSLQIWAGEKRLVMASFYFWASGSEMQKSQEGLLQSLLQQVLMHFPDLIPIVLPTQWKENSQTRPTSISWTRSELIAAINFLAQQSVRCAKFFFIIDGLDEYNGDHKEIIQVLRNFILSSKNTKMCISSRPWNMFQTEFGDSSTPKFLLEDLTRDDISLYVRSKLQENKLFRHLEEKDSRCQDLVTEVVDKAQGVFLWVYLVVNSLLKGLTNADRVSDLQLRLSLLPTELDKYFEHMLENIEDVYQDVAAQTFHIALHAEEPLTLMTFAMLDEEDAAYAMKWDIHPMDMQEIWSRYDDMMKRLNGRCRDLLEVTRVTSIPGMEEYETWRVAHSDRRLFRKELSTELFFIYRVDFLHRTVRDFLQSEDAQDMLRKRIKTMFSPNTSLCKAFLAQIKSILMRPEYLANSGPLVDLVNDMVHYARDSECRHGVAQSQLLDELNRVVHVHGKRYGHAFFKTVQRSCPGFLGFAAERGLELYLAEKMPQQLQRLPTSDAKLSTYLLCHALVSKDVLLPKYENCVHPGVIRLLLSEGAKPNRKHNGNTIWSKYLKTMSMEWSSLSRSAQHTHLKVINLLLDAGAEVVDWKGSLLLWVDFLLCDRNNWKTDDEEFLETLAKTIENFLDQGANSYQIYKGASIRHHYYENGPCIESVKSSRLRQTLRCVITKFDQCRRDKCVPDGAVSGTAGEDGGELQAGAEEELVECPTAILDGTSDKLFLVASVEGLPPPAPASRSSWFGWFGWK